MKEAGLVYRDLRPGNPEVRAEQDLEPRYVRRYLRSPLSDRQRPAIGSDTETGSFSGSPCRPVKREILACWVLTWRLLGGSRGTAEFGSTMRLLRGLASTAPWSSLGGAPVRVWQCSPVTAP